MPLFPEQKSLSRLFVLNRRLAAGTLLVALLLAVGALVAPAASVAKTTGYSCVTGWCSVVNHNSSECVDAAGGGTASGTVIQQYHCNNTYAQQFQFRPAGSGYYSVVNRGATTEVEV